MHADIVIANAFSLSMFLGPSVPTGGHIGLSQNYVAWICDQTSGTLMPHFVEPSITRTLLVECHVVAMYANFTSVTTPALLTTPKNLAAMNVALKPGISQTHLHLLLVTLTLQTLHVIDLGLRKARGAFPIYSRAPGPSSSSPGPPGTTSNHLKRRFA